jgi:hypothetical protein
VSQAAPSRGHEPEAPLPSPSPSPRAHRRRSPLRNSATSPWTAPSQPPLAELSLPVESPASAHAKPPSLGPRTGPPAANRRRAHRPFSLARPVRPRRLAATPFPPSALADEWARSDAVTLAHSRRLPSARGPPLGRKRARARARARGGPKTLPPAQQRRDLFSFSFSTFFSHLISFLQYFMHQKLPK